VRTTASGHPAGTPRFFHRHPTHPKEQKAMPTRVALIAHDHKKDDIVRLTGEYVDTLRRCALLATGTTGGRIEAAHGLNVERMLSGPHGGDLQIGAQLAEGKVDVVIFLRDPMTPQPHEPDINALVRACDVHDVPCATNISTARMILDVLTQRMKDVA
jgi:methylglyoxal synthase